MQRIAVGVMSTEQDRLGATPLHPWSASSPWRAWQLYYNSAHAHSGMTFEPRPHCSFEQIWSTEFVLNRAKITIQQPLPIQNTASGSGISSLVCSPCLTRNQNYYVNNALKCCTRGTSTCDPLPSTGRIQM